MKKCAISQVGEYVVAEIGGEMRLGRVLPWDERVTPPHVLQRQYLVDVYGDGRPPETLGHVDLYKIQRSCLGVDHHSLSLEVSPAPDVEENDNEEAKLDEVKGQLREMAAMNQQDYKRALRRLFLTWHPDKAGNTSFNNMIFRMFPDGDLSFFSIHVFDMTLL